MKAMTCEVVSSRCAEVMAHMDVKTLLPVPSSSQQRKIRHIHRGVGKTVGVYSATLQISIDIDLYRPSHKRTFTDECGKLRYEYQQLS